MHSENNMKCDVHLLIEELVRTSKIYISDIVYNILYLFQQLFMRLNDKPIVVFIENTLPLVRRCCDCTPSTSYQMKN